MTLSRMVRSAKVAGTWKVRPMPSRAWRSAGACVTSMPAKTMRPELGAIRADERAARSLGVPVRRYKLLALMLSAAFTSLAGSLYALKTGFIDPDSGLGILVSVQMIITAALGGAGTLFGPLLGAAILVPLQTATNTWLGGGGSGLTYIVYGGVIVLIARFEPGGLVELWQRVSAARRRRKAAIRHAA